LTELTELMASMVNYETTQDGFLNLLKQWLYDVCTKIAFKFGLITSTGIPKRAFVLDTLLRFSCRGCIFKVLSNPLADTRADAIYIENHRLAVSLLIEGLRQTFENNGVNVGIKQEVSGGVYGRPDLVVKPTNAGILIEGANFEVIVEVKTGSGFTYAQLIRYLLERPNSIGVIWRIPQNQLIVLDPKKHSHLINLCVLAAIKRGLDILDGKFEDCSHTPLSNKCSEIENVQELVEKFLKSLETSLPKAIKTICELVQANLETDHNSNSKE